MWVCWVTEKPLSKDQHECWCDECHTMSCPINVGLVEEALWVDVNVDNQLQEMITKKLKR